MKSFRILIALTILALLAGCATRGDVDTAPAPIEDRHMTDEVETDETDRSEGAQADGAGIGDEFYSEELEDPDSLLSQRVIYFDFDSNEVTPEFADVLGAHGEFLAAHPEVEMTVEGHTDERGSQEYNLALGERRAEAVKRILVLNGADPQQVQSVSFGEEKPAQDGNDEEAWSQNRRAELMYQR